MMYKNKTITKHKRGGWYVRVQFNNKVICLYGSTQLAVYDKLKTIADKVDQERLLQKLEGFITSRI